jgi:hypothetical protein
MRRGIATFRFLRLAPLTCDQRRSGWVLSLVWVVSMGIGLSPMGRRATQWGIDRLFPDQALSTGAIQGDLPAMDAALRNGANVNARGTYAGRTPLMVACIHGRVEVAAFLLAHGADPHSVDEKGLTALHLALRSKRPEIVTLLRAAGATR